MEGIELEGESPAFGIVVILFKDVDSTDVLPEVDWFLDGLDVEKAQKGGLTSSEISLNRNDARHIFYL